MKIGGVNPDLANVIDKTSNKANNPAESSPGIDFGELLNDAISRVNEMQKTSDEKSEMLAAGEADSLHEVVIASEKADLALNLTIQVRDKIVDAYNEMTRMQI